MKGRPVAGALVWLGQRLRCRERDGTGRGSSRDTRESGLRFYSAHVEGAGTVACRGRETEGPKRRTRGGSEWEPIKILFKNSAYESDFTRKPSHASLAKSTQPLECYWT
jgi:hypothetical protein